MAKEALLIVDMSNDFVADNGTLTVGKPAQEIVPYIKDVAASFLEEGNVVVVSMVHTVGVTTDICDFLTVAGADAEGFNTVIHKRGIATFTDLGETMLNHMKRCFHTQIIE